MTSPSREPSNSFDFLAPRDAFSVAAAVVDAVVVLCSNCLLLSDLQTLKRV